MPDPVRPVAPREEQLRQLIAKWRETSEERRQPARRKGVKVLGVSGVVRNQCADELEDLLAVSPVPWAGSGAEAEEDLTRVDRQSLSDRQDLPRKPQPEGSQQS